MVDTPRSAAAGVVAGAIEPMRFDRPALHRAAAAVSAAPSPAPSDRLPGGVTRGEAEAMANAAQALWTVLRRTPEHVLEGWLQATPEADRQAVLAAVIGVRASMR